MRNKPIIDHSLDYCFLCGRPAHGVHHLLFGQDRENADFDGVYIAICDGCHILGKYKIHDNPTAERLSKMLGQALWMLKDMNDNHVSMEDSNHRFIKRYGRSYL